MDLPALGPGPLAWYALFAGCVLVLYALIGDGIAIEWPVKANLPKIDRGRRIGIAGVAAIAFVCAFLLYQRADYVAYTERVDQLVNGSVNADAAGIAFSEGFADAQGSEHKKCYLGATISARLNAMKNDPPVIPDNVIKEIRSEFKAHSVGCYVKLAQDLINAVQRRKQEEYAKASRFGLDAVENRDTPDFNNAEVALGKLAPTPIASGWIYLGKFAKDGALHNSALESGKTIGQKARVERESLIEQTKPDIGQDAPDLAGVYATNSTVRIRNVVKQGSYGYALVDFDPASNTLALESL